MYKMPDFLNGKKQLSYTQVEESHSRIQSDPIRSDRIPIGSDQISKGSDMDIVGIRVADRHPDP